MVLVKQSIIDSISNFHKTDGSDIMNILTRGLYDTSGLVRCCM